MVADALYEYGQTGFSHKTDLAVTNGGGLRETIAKDKPITKGDVIAVLPVSYKHLWRFGLGRYRCRQT